MSALAAKKHASRGLRLVVDAGRDPVSGLPHLSLVAQHSAASPALSLASYLEGRYRPTLDIRRPTIEDYVRTWRTFILPYLGEHDVTELNAEHIEVWLVSLKRDGYSNHQRAHAYRVLRAALNRAVAKRIIEASPVAGIRCPRPAPRELEPLTRDEANAYLDAFEEHPVEIAVLLALAAGLRLSEMAALEWSDIDLREGVVHVRKALRHVYGGTVLQEPKSARSRRDVSLPAWAVSRLETLRDAGPVFAIQPQGISASYRRHVRSCDLRYVPLRDLRHSHATLLLASGVDIVAVSRRLGHQSVATTDAFYLAPGRAADHVAAKRANSIRRVQQPKRRKPHEGHRKSGVT